MRFVEQISIKGWIRIGVLNLLLVAVLGILMRLKFILPIPFLDLKHVQHAHSHFAFAGWVTHMLMLFLVLVTFRLQKKRQSTTTSKQNLVFEPAMFSWYAF